MQKNDQSIKKTNKCPTCGPKGYDECQCPKKGSGGGAKGSGGSGGSESNDKKTQSISSQVTSEKKAQNQNATDNTVVIKNNPNEVAASQLFIANGQRINNQKIENKDKDGLQQKVSGDKEKVSADKVPTDKEEGARPKPGYLNPFSTTLNRK